MGGLGTVVSGDEGPEIGPRVGEGHAEGGDKGCDFGGMVEFAELEVIVGRVGCCGDLDDGLSMLVPEI